MTISITRACQSACLTCSCGSETRKGLVNVTEELSLDEWLRIVNEIDWRLAFLTISGGEPSMSRNLVPVALAFAEQTKPDFVTIPTNALAPERVIAEVQRILQKSPPEVVWHINISVDGVAGVHDHVRGVNGNFEKCLETVNGLLSLREKYPRLRVGVHTVVSTYTIDTLEETVNFFKAAQLDNHISEIAEERFELGTIGRMITPYARYAEIVPVLKEALGAREDGKTRRALRNAYYEFAQKWTQDPTRQHVPCMAGVASCHITERGYLTTCCTRWTNKGMLGSLREADYSIRKLWFSSQAAKIRRSIQLQECACPLASAAYSSLLMDPKTLIKILKDYLS